MMLIRLSYSEMQAISLDIDTGTYFAIVKRDGW